MARLAVVNEQLKEPSNCLVCPASSASMPTNEGGLMVWRCDLLHRLRTGLLSAASWIELVYFAVLFSAISTPFTLDLLLLILSWALIFIAAESSLSLVLLYYL